MPTAQVRLDPNKYVRINAGKNRVMLQSLRDAVRIVFSDDKPSTSNTSFHLLNKSSNIEVVDVVDTNIWAMATSDNCGLIITENIEPEVTISRETEHQSHLETQLNLILDQLMTQTAILNEMSDLDLTAGDTNE